MTIRRLCLLIGFAAGLVSLPGQTREPQLDLRSAVAWDRMELTAEISLDLASAGLKLPTGRSQAEQLCVSEFPRLILPRLFALALDSSTTVADAIASGDIRLSELQELARTAPRTAAVLSSDIAKLSVAYSVDLVRLVDLTLKHRRAATPPWPLELRATRDFTGIVIYADDSLPVHGTKVWASAKACLYPKIWDSDMNLVYERNMAEPEAARGRGIARYAAADEVQSWRELVGDNPLRILATGVFGKLPTDPIIAKDDALKIVSSDANRRLLREGRIVIVVGADSLYLE